MQSSHLHRRTTIVWLMAGPAASHAHHSSMALPLHMRWTADQSGGLHCRQAKSKHARLPGEDVLHGSQKPAHGTSSDPSSMLIQSKLRGQGLAVAAELGPGVDVCVRMLSQVALPAQPQRVPQMTATLTFQACWSLSAAAAALCLRRHLAADKGSYQMWTQLLPSLVLSISLRCMARRPCCCLSFVQLQVLKHLPRLFEGIEAG